MNANASNYDPSSGAYYYGQPQTTTAAAGGHQQATMYDASYVDPSMDAYYGGEQAGYYVPQPEMHATDPTAAYGEWTPGGVVAAQQLPLVHPPDPSELVEDGYYFPKEAIQSQAFGDPITAIAYDDAYEAMYVASAALSGGPRRRVNEHRSSMLYTHSTLDGSLYSMVAGHPEAPAHILNAVYDSIYGVTAGATSPTSKTIPLHAYRPPYGSSDPALAATLYNKYYQMGINTLVPLSGYVASVSPAGVRLHTHGGLQVADLHLEGMVCGTAHPGLDSQPSHMTVGGLAMAMSDHSSSGPTTTTTTTSRNQLVCVDLWQGLRTVASHSFGRGSGFSPNNHKVIVVNALTTSQSNGSVLAGCSDGTIRMLDGGLREMAKIKSHVGGVAHVAVSADGTLIASTGFGSRASRASKSPIYGYPDPSVLIYDIRYLGRGGFAHPFAGMRGGPRFVSFLPDVEGAPSNRVLVGSGQSGGGLQIIEPFQEASDNAANFILPPLERDSITAMCVSDENLALGTAQGSLLHYELKGFGKKTSRGIVQGGVFVPSSNAGGFTPQSLSSGGRSASKAKLPLEMPSFAPKPPPLSIEASLLQRDNPNERTGLNANLKAIFSTYTLMRDPTVSNLGDSRDESKTTFGHLATSPMVAPSNLRVSASLFSKATHTVDFLKTIPTADINLDLMEDHRPDRVKERLKGRKPPQPNPNKLLYTAKVHPIAYEESLNRLKKLGRRAEKGLSTIDSADDVNVPSRYRLMMRPTHKSASSFNHGESNETGLIPGWDYPPTMPNAFIPPVLMLLYFIPEVKAAVMPGIDKPSTRLLPELAALFHRIDGLSRYAMLFPEKAADSVLARVGAWAPTSFISYLSTMPEAEQLQILDGSPAAVDAPRRPEAFYRFLLYQLSKETSGKNSSQSFLDSLGGMSFVSINEFITGSDPPTQSATRAMTVDLFYDSSSNDSQSPVRFGNVLQATLCRETRLRAWSSGSKSYETIVQRKIVTSLPKILSLCCACAGRNEEDGLKVWRTDEGGCWLPELLEIELDVGGSVIVREFVSKDGETEEGEWVECVSKQSMPKAISEIVDSLSQESGVRRRRYRLESVLSMVRDDLDRNCGDLHELAGEGPFGHHVLHARVSKEHQMHIMSHQIGELEKALRVAAELPVYASTLIGPALESGDLEKRLELAKSKLVELEESKKESDWILMNGFLVSNTYVEDATAFHVKFKEPSLLVYRSIDDKDEAVAVPTLDCTSVSQSVLKTQSIASGTKPKSQFNALPIAGQLLAFDAEFVSVQEEESTLTEAGSKLIVRETRYAVARISVIDCDSGTVLIDDYVLPRERVVDYLTRFSGIVAEDLDPKQSNHHLISTRAAYLKLRYLMERGCIFVGHGLGQDFWTVNLAVPPNQIVDTVEIYHKPAQRYISLRFLTNFVLKRDMQQDVHDSVEDALAAYELYAKATELKRRNSFEALLNDLYAYGQKNDWKLGVDDDDDTAP